jgi:hypothetical protein
MNIEVQQCVGCEARSDHALTKQGRIRFITDRIAWLVDLHANYSPICDECLKDVVTARFSSHGIHASLELLEKLAGRRQQVRASRAGKIH